MTDQFRFDKNAVDTIISTLTNVGVVKIDDYHLHLDGKALGCNEDGVYVNVWEGKYSLVMRGMAFPFEEFPWWQRRRLEKFFDKKRAAYLKARKEWQDAYHRDAVTKNLNTTLTELVKHGK